MADKLMVVIDTKPDFIMEGAAERTQEDVQNDMERMRSMMAHFFSPVIEIEAGEAPSLRERVVVVDGPHARYADLIMAASRELDNASPDIIIVDILERFERPQEPMMIHNRTLNFDLDELHHQIMQALLPKQTAWERLRDNQSGPKKGRTGTQGARRIKHNRVR